MDNRITLHEAEQFAASQGIAITPADRRRISEAQAAELERLTTLERDDDQRGNIARWVDGFNAFYPRFLEALVRVGDVLLTTSQTVIVAFGVPSVLVLLLIVEHQRVLHGISLFEQDPGLASFAALALVITNLVLEFTIHYVEQRAGYHAARSTRWSLRTWLRGAAYTLGIGGGWEPLTLSPAQRYRRLLSLITFTILALALAGSMRTVIDGTSGAWYEALRRIVTDSSLSQMFVWAGGLLFAAAAVFAVQGLSRYVAIRCAEIITRMSSSRNTQDRYADQLSAAGGQVVIALVNSKTAAKRQKDAAKSGVPFGNTQTIPVDDEPTEPIDPQPVRNANGGAIGNNA